MKKALLTLCACIFVCTHDCRANSALDECILDNSTQSELDTYNSFTGSDMNSVMHKSMTYRALYDKYCSTDEADTTAIAEYLASAVASSTSDVSSAAGIPKYGQTIPESTQSVCASDMRHGTNPKTGECIECPVGKFFNAKDSANGYCSTAIALSKSDLKYGYKSRTLKSRVSQQCWTKKNPAEYKACVKYGMQAPVWTAKPTSIAPMPSNVSAVK